MAVAGRELAGQRVRHRIFAVAQEHRVGRVVDLVDVDAARAAGTALVGEHEDVVTSAVGEHLHVVGLRAGCRLDHADLGRLLLVVDVPDPDTGLVATRSVRTQRREGAGVGVAIEGPHVGGHAGLEALTATSDSEILLDLGVRGSGNDVEVSFAQERPVVVEVVCDGPEVTVVVDVDFTGLVSDSSAVGMCRCRRR